MRVGGATNGTEYVGIASRPYKLVTRSNTPEWLEARERYVTASEAVYASGAKEPRQWRRRPEKPGDKMWWGHFDEEHIVRAVTKLTGLRARPVGWLLASTDVPGAGASLDGVALVPEVPDTWLAWVATESGLSDRAVRRFRQDVATLLDGGDRRIGLEIKLTGGDWHDWDADSPPAEYWWQAQHQLLVTGWPAVLLAAREGAFTLHAHYLVLPDADAQRKLRKACKTFAKTGKKPWKQQPAGGGRKGTT